MSTDYVTDYIKRRDAAQRKIPSPLGTPGEPEPLEPRDGEDPVAAFIRQRDARNAKIPNPLFHPRDGGAA